MSWEETEWMVLSLPFSSLLVLLLLLLRGEELEVARELKELLCDEED